MPEITLPTEKVGPVSLSPRTLIIFSKPKVGKSSLAAGLDSCLLIDLEDGAGFLEALKISAGSVDELKKVGEAIKAAGNPYKYIALDTMSALEKICIPYAETLYARSIMGKHWFRKEGDKLHPESGKAKYGNILNMPDGAGYKWHREAVTKVIDFVKTLAPRIILLGHIKEILLQKGGSEFNTFDLDLTGKLKSIITSQVDAIGYLYRKGNQNVLSFKTNDEVTCGARPEHLKNKEIVVSEAGEDGKLTTFWERIYID